MAPIQGVGGLKRMGLETSRTADLSLERRSDVLLAGRETTGVLRPRADGRVESETAVALPLMAGRLQGELEPTGALTLSLWGAGALGRIRLSALPGPFVYAPNSVEAAGGAGLWLAQSVPAVLIRGVRLLGVAPARRSSGWTPPSRAVRERHGALHYVELPWGWMIVCEADGEVRIAAGADRDEADQGLALSAQDIVSEAQAYIARCDRLPEADPLLRSMISQGTHAALSSVRSDTRGRFLGLSAGAAYSTPARTYYRDGYWTTPLLLQVEPRVVAAQIDLLAAGVRGDGEAPSGVMVSAADEARAWERAKGAEHKGVLDWWSDHFDSPLFFVLMLADYVAATGDAGLAERHWPEVEAIFGRYVALSDPDGLPIKPRHDRDWADNVFREGRVAYDLGLWVGACEAVARLAAERDGLLADQARQAAARARAGIEALWQPTGWYADYAAEGFVERHLAVDSLTLLRHDAAPEERALEVLAACRRQLESRHNPAQPWGDWGVLCAYPPFARRRDLRSKTAFPFRYHNGGDWPWLDGLYAGERLRRGLPGWRYPLVRWWETSLAQGWMGAVEYFSPPFGRGSLLQAWSSLPAAMALQHRETVLAGDPD